MFLQSVISSLKQSKTAILLPVFLVLLALPLTLAAVRTTTVTRQGASVSLSSLQNGFTLLGNSSKNLQDSITNLEATVKTCPITPDQAVSILDNVTTMQGIAYNSYTKINKELIPSINLYKPYLSKDGYTTLITHAQALGNDYALMSASLGNIYQQLSQANDNGTLYQNNCINPSIISFIQSEDQKNLVGMHDVDGRILPSLTALIPGSSK